MNLSIFSIIVIDTWYTKSGILSNKNDELEKQLYDGLAEEIIYNKINDVYDTKRKTQSTADGSSILDIMDGCVASGVGMYLTPTKTLRHVSGSQTNYIQQDWSAEVMGVETRIGSRQHIFVQ